MSARNNILAKLSEPPSAEIPVVQAWTKPISTDLWKSFATRVQSLGGKIATLDEVIGLGKVWIEKDVRHLVPEMTPHDEIWTAETGITGAEIAIAETGSILIHNQPGGHRMASLLPPRHVVLISESRIVSTLEEGLAHDPTRSSVLITGTSRTADIEGFLVRGVHGPRELWVVVLPGV